MIRIWDTAGGVPVATLDIANRAVLAGETLQVWTDVAGGPDRVPLDPRRWADQLCRAVGRDLTADERRELPPGSSTDPVCA